MRSVEKPVVASKEEVVKFVRESTEEQLVAKIGEALQIIAIFSVFIDSVEVLSDGAYEAIEKVQAL